ncbi:transporter substrate-binding domain-containing protein [Frigidibacter sp. MR17.14]|uniref:substrate-binding periplasmic protein n=1 Tax=Frigidibacter sp. MR17.14 TaxID=3126509 RepID=UPI0030129DC9
MTVTPRRTLALLAALGLALPAGLATAAPVIDENLQITLPTPQPWAMRNLIKDGTLIVATTAKTKGETFIGDDGTLQGARIDLWNKIAEDLGLKTEYVTIDWAGVMPGLAANRFDLACEGASWTPERLTSPDFFMTRPVKVAVNVGVVRADSGIDSWDQAQGKKLGGVKGEIELKDLIAHVPGADADAALSLPGVSEARLALMNGQIDVYGTGIQAAKSLLAGPDGDKLKILAEPTKVGVGGFCVNRNEPDLAQAVNFLLAKYRADGTMTAINEKWDLPDYSDLLGQLGY